jgi:branched-chain amino acid transport system substrate-binding protein
MKRYLSAVLVCVCLAMPTAHAVNAGVTSNEIKLGASLAMSGPLGPGTKLYGDGAMLLFDEVNRKGGINGRKISFKRVDDAFDVKRTVENTKKLIEEDNVFMIFNNTGTAHTSAILPMIEESKTIIFGPITGAPVFREKFNRYLFNVRGSYVDEAKQIAAQLKLTGINRVAIAVQTDSLGTAIGGEFAKAIEAEKIQLVLKTTLDNKAPDFNAAAKAIVEARPEAVLLATGGTIAAGLTKAIHAMPTTNRVPPFYGSSVSGADTVIRELGKKARGMVFAQIVPSLRDRREPIVAEYRSLLAKKDPKAVPTANGLDGFIHAKVLVEGLNRAGRNLTTDSFIAAMESIKSLQFGKFIAKYSPTSHNGSSYVELGIVDSELLLRY